MLSTVKLKTLMAPGQCAAWIFFAKVRKREGVGGKVGFTSGVLRACVTSGLIFRKSFPVRGPEPDPSVILMTISEVLCPSYQHDIIFITLLEGIIPSLSLNFTI